MLRKGSIFIIFIILSLYLSGCCNQKASIIKPEDIEFKVSIRPFYSEAEYMTYVSKSITENMGNTFRFDLEWQLKNGDEFSQLFYSPYIIIIPPDNDWLYLGANQNIPPLFGNRIRISDKILKQVFNNLTSRELTDVKAIESTHLHAKSFGQGFISVAYFKDNMHDMQTGKFRIYLVYYDPLRNNGWYKAVDQRVSPRN